jgi:Flp pilus assembly protein TadG
MRMNAMTKRASGCLANWLKQLHSTWRFAGWRADPGASLLELAILSPFLLSLLIGVMEFGRYSYYSILVANAARAGAQYGAQNLGTAADTTGIKNAASQDGQNLAALTITSAEQCGCTGSTLSTICPATSCTPPAHPLVYVQVTATASINSMFNYPGVPKSLGLSSTNTMRVGQ